MPMKKAFAILMLMSMSFIPTHLRSQAPVRMEFEAATIKPNTTANGYSGGCHGTGSTLAPNDPNTLIPLGRCVIRAARLSHLMGIAFGVSMPRLSGHPSWDGPSRFDVEAKAENLSATNADLIAMLQTLLIDRFKLKFHIEKREVSGFALVIARNGSKLKEGRPDRRPSMQIMGAAISKFDAAEGKNLDLNRIIAQRGSIAELAAVLTNLPDHPPVVDRTGLTGLYDFALSWEPTESISAVLQEQLGLRLEPQKVPVDFYVIDSAEKPSGN